VSKRNLKATVVAFGSVIILFFPSVILSGLFMHGYPKYWNFFPVYLLFISAPITTWLISKNWVITVVVFLISILVLFLIFKPTPDAHISF